MKLYFSSLTLNKTALLSFSLLPSLMVLLLCFSLISFSFLSISASLPFSFLFSLAFCIFSWSSRTCFAVNGTSDISYFLRVKEYLLVKPSCVTRRSYCHSLPNRM
ncbi:hypothetical protein PanWU01x14_196030 [Parasponia andersonii]|uniref:Transmembrane protein n=1 Tax=Parasponia andersonii TaxID=3476 RepID=A0A2P5C014_PARAD|nr:hypothetical protein PanWU01x14_196030 [Parasponia andersonii]